jgi:macrodomain Ter protein organizer (MatP/YcbG family)
MNETPQTTRRAFKLSIDVVGRLEAYAARTRRTLSDTVDILLDERLAELESVTDTRKAG